MKKHLFILPVLASLTTYCSAMDIGNIREYVNRHNIEENESINVILHLKDDVDMEDGSIELKKYSHEIEVVDLSYKSIVVELPSMYMDTLEKLQSFQRGTVLVTEKKPQKTEVQILREQARKNGFATVLISIRSTPPLFTIKEDGSFEKIESKIKQEPRYTLDDKLKFLQKSYPIQKTEADKFSILEKFKANLSEEQIGELSRDGTLFLTSVEHAQNPRNEKLRLSRKIVEEASDIYTRSYTIQIRTPKDYEFASRFFNVAHLEAQNAIFEDVLKSLVEKYFPGKSEDLNPITAGFATVPLTRGELLKLINSHDPRLESIEDGNKMVSYVSMNYATGSGPGGTALANAWPVNQGSDAWIAILDTGVNLAYQKFIFLWTKG